MYFRFADKYECDIMRHYATLCDGGGGGKDGAYYVRNGNERGLLVDGRLVEDGAQMFYTPVHVLGEHDELLERSYRVEAFGVDDVAHHVGAVPGQQVYTLLYVVVVLGRLVDTHELGLEVGFCALVHHEPRARLQRGRFEVVVLMGSSDELIVMSRFHLRVM